MEIYVDFRLVLNININPKSARFPVASSVRKCLL